MKKWVFVVLIKRLIEYASFSKVEVFRNDKKFFILKDHNIYIIIPKKKTNEFLKVYFVNIRTNKIELIYRTKLIFYKEIFKKIKSIYRKFNYINIEKY